VIRFLDHAAGPFDRDGSAGCAVILRVAALGPWFGERGTERSDEGGFDCAAPEPHGRRAPRRRRQPGVAITATGITDRPHQFGVSWAALGAAGRFRPRRGWLGGGAGRVDLQRRIEQRLARKTPIDGDRGLSDESLIGRQLIAGQPMIDLGLDPLLHLAVEVLKHAAAPFERRDHRRQRHRNAGNTSPVPVPSSHGWSILRP
jgi:hypothetical protein